MEALESFVGALNGILWGPIMLVVLVGTGIFFSIRTPFVQVRRFGAAMKRVFGGFSLQGAKAGKDGMSSFQALTTAIAAQVGTGNIAAVQPPSCPADPEPSSGCGCPPFSECQQSTPRQFLHRRQRQGTRTGM